MQRDRDVGALDDTNDRDGLCEQMLKYDTKVLSEALSFRYL
jgi:hypothetical protein